MADPNNSNADVIAAARGMRVGYPFMAPPADDDPNTAGLATHGSTGGPIGETVVRGKRNCVGSHAASALR